MSFFSHCDVKYLTKPCHDDIIRLVDALLICMETAPLENSMTNILLRLACNVIITQHEPSLLFYTGVESTGPPWVF